MQPLKLNIAYGIDKSQPILFGARHRRMKPFDYIKINSQTNTSTS